MKYKSQEERQFGICLVEGCPRRVEDYGELGSSDMCGDHNDVLIDHANQRAEFHHYHPK